MQTHWIPTFRPITDSERIHKLKQLPQLRLEKKSLVGRLKGWFGSKSKWIMPGQPYPRHSNSIKGKVNNWKAASTTQTASLQPTPRLQDASHRQIHVTRLQFSHIKQVDRESKELKGSTPVTGKLVSQDSGSSNKDASMVSLDSEDWAIKSQQSLKSLEQKKPNLSSSNPEGPIRISRLTNSFDFHELGRAWTRQPKWTK